MHMQDGVGRQGYRLLAWVCLGIGIVGLGWGWYAWANQLFPGQWLGFGLAAVSLAGLVTVNLTVLSKPEAPAQAEPAAPAAAAAPQTAPPAPRARPAETPAQRLPPPKTMVRLGPAVPPKPKQKPQEERPETVTKEASEEAGIEFKDATPAARAAPTEMVLPAAFDGSPVPGEQPWPERRGPSGVLLGEMQNRAAGQLAVTPPVVMAKIWYPQSAMPRGWGKGQCGDCGTALVAPPQRPIRLRCPHCDKVTDLA